MTTTRISLFGHLRAVYGVLIISLNTLLVFPIILLCSVLRIIPYKTLNLNCRRMIALMAYCWLRANDRLLGLFKPSNLNVIGDYQVDASQTYLIIANHQCWTDINILQKIFTQSLGVSKFFIKQSLLFIPFIGFVFWMLDFPIMKRYSKAYLAKHPERKGQDLLATQKKCQGFLDIPSSIITFVEGTRFTAEKQHKQQSPYQYLLKPRAGGLANAIHVLASKLTAIIDVTIVYPDGKPNYWQFLAGKLQRVDVHIKMIPITEQLIGDYQHNKQFKQAFINWLNQQWQAKDRLIAEHF